MIIIAWYIVWNCYERIFQFTGHRILVKVKRIRVCTGHNVHGKCTQAHKQRLLGAMWHGTTGQHKRMVILTSPQKHMTVTTFKRHPKNSFVTKESIRSGMIPRTTSTKRLVI